MDDQNRQAGPDTQTIPNAHNPQVPQSAGFEFNRPTIIALCYLGSALTGISGLVGLILAYVWRNETHEAWESSHYTYLIQTAWLGILGSIACIVLMLVLIGAFLLPVLGVLVVIRCVLSLLNAQKHAAMPNPETWLA